MQRTCSESFEKLTEYSTTQSTFVTLDNNAHTVVTCLGEHAKNLFDPYTFITTVQLWHVRGGNRDNEAYTAPNRGTNSTTRKCKL